METKSSYLPTQLECLRIKFLESLDVCKDDNNNCRDIARAANCLRVCLDWIEQHKITQYDQLWHDLECKADTCASQIDHWLEILKDRASTVESIAGALNAVAGLAKPFIV